jgi:hypothetical protein
MLGANAVNRHKKAFLSLTPGVIEEMLTICPRLYNMVHGRNKESIRWLKWLGFTIDDPVPHGPDSELFHKFHLEVGNV